MSVVEAKCHLLQVQDKLAPGDALVAFQFGLGIAPEILDAVDVAAPTGSETLPMVDAVMSIALGNQAVVAGELVRVDGTSLRHLLADDRAQGVSGHIGTGRV